MTFVVDRDHPGTPESAWRRSGELAGLPAVALGRPSRTVVVAPHPDDEILGVGGVLQHLVAVGSEVGIVAVTDGEASRPGATPARKAHLRGIRRRESELALRRLGIPAPTVTRLGITDGGVAVDECRVAAAVEATSGPDDLVLAPWWRDGHPDHDACGRAARRAAAVTGARTLHYLVWAWHWADPHGGLPYADCQRFDFDRPTSARKCWAIEAFASQIRPVGPDPEEEPVLPPAVLARFARTFEVFVGDVTQT